MTTLLIPDPSLILLIGPSGAGKSTFAARHFNPTQIVSSDRCRAMISDDENDQSVNQAAFALLHHLVRARLSLAKLTVVDATNLQAGARRSLLRMARGVRIPILAIVFNLSLEDCMARNRLRPNRVVLEEVIRTQSAELSSALPLLSIEGFDRVYLLEKEELDDAVVERIGLHSSESGVHAH